MKEYSKAGELRSYGRRKARRLSEAQQDVWDNMLPTLQVTLPKRGLIEIDALQHGYKTCWLEIGFGAGEHLVHMAQTYPDILFIGCEPFANGVAKCLLDIKKYDIKNIVIFPDDVQILLDALPDNSITRCDILFPDPWRKKAHYKRRLVNPVTLDKISRIMPYGAHLWLASDHENYVEWMLEHIMLHPHFEWMAESKSDFAIPPKDWTITRYQEKALKEGRYATFIQCCKI